MERFYVHESRLMAVGPDAQPSEQLGVTVVVRAEDAQKAVAEARADQSDLLNRHGEALYAKGQRDAEARIRAGVLSLDVDGGWAVEQSSVLAVIDAAGKP